MRALVCAEAIRCRVLRSASMRPSRSWDHLPGTEKYSRKRFNHYVQNAISLCIAVLMFTIFLFLLCTLDPGWKGMDQPWLRSDSISFGSRSKRVLHSSENFKISSVISTETNGNRASALHGMGILFRKGSRSMSELIVAHLEEATTQDEFRLFLRTLHRSGATARADVVFLFPWTSLPESIADVVREEESSFQQLMLEMQSSAPPHIKKIPKEGYESVEGSLPNAQQGRTRRDSLDLQFPKSNSSISKFHSMAFWKSREEGKPRGDVTWENRSTHAQESNGSYGMGAVDAVEWGDWGSIVGFEMEELDSDNVLKGFIEYPPAQLRRWICYQMLLGMVKSRYRNVLLTEVGGVLIIGDVLSAMRKKSFDSGLYLYQEDQSWADLQRARESKLPRSPIASGNKDGDASEHNNEVHKEIDGEGHDDSLALEVVSCGPSQLQNDPSCERPEMQFIEEVYGKEKWKVMDKEDKEKAVLGTGFIMGSMKPIRSVLNTMSTEIVGVAALVRKSRQSFHDRALLNFLVHKSSVLSKRVTDKLRVLTNADSSVHSLPGSKQGSIFFKESGDRFAALQGLKDEQVNQETVAMITRTVFEDICSSHKVYADCPSHGTH